ncbi:lipopolysaccharide biosynthesis protein [Pedobacter deserti]|uniref:lipopolysaccharide biosynthesis protein n=1 Tax=Pedobacter deserti TaxID=2817382 RepID=UPI00210E5FFB|nr:hypothetical protein [Pedobacter sp. SYSU D00382]
MSTRSNLFKNGIATGIQKAVRVLDQLALVPFFISAWGAAYYGEWLTLTIIPSVLAFSDLGFGSAAASSFVLKYASDDKQGAANVFRSGFAIISCMITFGVLVSVMALFVLDHYKVFDKSLIDSKDTILAVSILIGARFIGFYSQLFESQFRAARKASLSINFQTINSACNIVGGIIVLLSGYKIVEYAISQLIISVLFNLFYAYKAKETLGLLKVYKGKIVKQEVTDITKKGFGYLMNPIWQSVFFQGSTFVVRVTLGPESVTIFNTARTATRSVTQLFQMVETSVFPEMQYEVGARNFNKARRLFSASVWTSFVIGVFGVIFLGLFGTWLYEIWTNHALHIPDTVWYIFISSILFNALWWTTVVVFWAFNKPYHFTSAGTAGAVLAVISSYFLTLHFGLVGAAMGSLLLDILMICYALPMCCKMLGMSVWELIRNGSGDLINLTNSFSRKIRSVIK